MEHNDTPTFEVAGLVRFAQVPKWIVRHPALSVGAKALYADIMTYADNETRAAFPGRERMAEDLNVSVSTIGRYIKEVNYGDTEDVTVVHQPHCHGLVTDAIQLELYTSTC